MNKQTCVLIVFLAGTTLGQNLWAQTSSLGAKQRKSEEGKVIPPAPREAQLIERNFLLTLSTREISACEHGLSRSNVFGANLNSQRHSAHLPIIEFITWRQILSSIDESPAIGEA